MRQCHITLGMQPRCCGGDEVAGVRGPGEDTANAQAAGQGRKALSDRRLRCSGVDRAPSCLWTRPRGGCAAAAQVPTGLWQTLPSQWPHLHVLPSGEWQASDCRCFAKREALQRQAGGLKAVDWRSSLCTGVILSCEVHTAADAGGCGGLRSRGADIDAEELTGNSPLHLAASSGHLTLLSTLLQAPTLFLPLPLAARPRPRPIKSQDVSQATDPVLVQRCAAKRHPTEWLSQVAAAIVVACRMLSEEGPSGRGRSLCRCRRRQT